MRKIIDNKLFKIIYGLFKFIIIAILVLYIAFLLVQRLSNNNSVMGYRVFTIITGSMEPTIEVGDVILVADISAEDLKVDDIITYKSTASDSEGMLITHRIIDINEEDGMITTKGDANDVEDQPITSEQVYGKMTYKFVLISLLTKIIRNKFGFYFLVFIPLVIVMFLEIADFVTQPKDDEDEKETSE